MRLKILSWLLLWTYVAFVYWVTVFSRAVYIQSSINWTPFWTYKAIINEGKDNLIEEIVVNILMFFPIGVLLGFALKKYGWLLVLPISICLSLGIELLQINFKRGLCETDDIIHNTLGCLIGLTAVSLTQYYYKKKTE